jgi:rare lipoprotein A
MRITLLSTIFWLIAAGLSGQSDACTASYYHNKFEGRKTASGAIFRQDSLMCAHKSLPFGTLIRVTNLKNDSTVIVKVTDRLPQSSKRCVDLTIRAAKQLNFVAAGLTKVHIEVLGEEKKEPVLKEESPEIKE